MNNFKRVKFSNIFSYGPDNEIYLDKNQLTQVVGKNGHGKSSLALILEEGLFNTNSKKLKRSDVLNRYISGAKGYIEIEFMQGNTTYLVINTRGTTNSIKLLKNGVDISSHTSTGTYKTIENILGYDHKTFSQIVYQSSVSSLEFLTATDTARKNFLIDLLNLSVYSRAGDVFKTIATEVNKGVDKLSSSINTVEKWLEKFEKEDLTAKELIVVLDEPIAEITRAEEIKKQLATLNITNKRISANNTYRQILNDLGNPVNTLVKPNQEEINSLKVDLGTLEKELKQSHISQTSKTKTCPTCKTELDNTATYEMYQQFSLRKPILETEIKSTKDKVAVLEYDTKLWQQEEAKVLEWEKYHALVDRDMDIELLNEAELTKEFKKLKDSITSKIYLIEEAKAHNTKVTAHNAKVSVLVSQKADMTKEISGHRNKLILLIKEQTKVALLVKTFSNTGLVAYKIECLVKDLETITNEYLATLADGRFQLSFVINASDKLNVVICDNGNDIDINALSTGERARVNVATLLAIRKLMQTLSNSRTNLLILDETVSNLDAYGKEKLIEVLLEEDSLNTFIIAHDYSHPLLEQLNVSKVNNISRITNG